MRVLALPKAVLRLHVAGQALHSKETEMGRLRLRAW